MRRFNGYTGDMQSHHNKWHNGQQALSSGYWRTCLHPPNTGIKPLARQQETHRPCPEGRYADAVHVPIRLV
jgi:hypothetical protein